MAVDRNILPPHVRDAAVGLEHAYMERSGKLANLGLASTIVRTDRQADDNHVAAPLHGEQMQKSGKDSGINH